MSGGPLLEIRGLRAGFVDGRTLYPVLHGVDLTIRAGSITALVGESGGGKTLLALAIMRLLPAAARIVDGRILLRDDLSPQSSVLRRGETDNAIDLLRLDEPQLCRIRGRRIGMVFQEPAGALNPIMRVGTQVEEAIRLHKSVSRAEARSQAVALLARMGLPDPPNYARRYPHQLSGGMQQRVMLAIALAARPAMLIADECTSALDVTVQAEILALLRGLRDEAGLTVLLITHDWGVVAEAADEVAVLDSGKIVEHRTIHEAFTAPQAAATRRLLDAARTLRAGAGHA